MGNLKRAWLFSLAACDPAVQTGGKYLPEGERDFCKEGEMHRDEMHIARARIIEMTVEEMMA